MKYSRFAALKNEYVFLWKKKEMKSLVVVILEKREEREKEIQNCSKRKGKYRKTVITQKISLPNQNNKNNE